MHFASQLLITASCLGRVSHLVYMAPLNFFSDMKEIAIAFCKDIESLISHVPDTFDMVSNYFHQQKRQKNQQNAPSLISRFYGTTQQLSSSYYIFQLGSGTGLTMIMAPPCPQMKMVVHG